MRNMKMTSLDRVIDFLKDRKLRDNTVNIDELTVDSVVRIKEEEETEEKSKTTELDDNYPIITLKDQKTKEDLVFGTVESYNQFMSVLKIPTRIIPHLDIKTVEAIIRDRKKKTHSDHLFREIDIRNDGVFVVRGVLSSGYQIFNHDEAIEPIYENLLNISSGEVDRFYYDYNNMDLRFLTEKIGNANPELDDIMQFGISQHNGETGHRSYGFDLILLRIACLNGVLREIDEAKFRHRGYGIKYRAERSFHHAWKQLEALPKNIAKASELAVVTPAKLSDVYTAIYKKAGLPKDELVNPSIIAYHQDEKPLNFSLHRIAQGMAKVGTQDKVYSADTILNIQKHAGRLYTDPKAYGLKVKPFSDLTHKDIENLEKAIIV